MALIFLSTLGFVANAHSAQTCPLGYGKVLVHAKKIYASGELFMQVCLPVIEMEPLSEDYHDIMSECSGFYAPSRDEMPQNATHEQLKNMALNWLKHYITYRQKLCQKLKLPVPFSLSAPLIEIATH
jgi:hypothetical protein